MCKNGTARTWGLSISLWTIKDWEVVSAPRALTEPSRQPCLHYNSLQKKSVRVELYVFLLYMVDVINLFLNSDQLVVDKHWQALRSISGIQDEIRVLCDCGSTVDFYC